MKYPIGIISFNRPHYLKELVESLAGQHGEALTDREIHLFQDGAIVGGQRYANDEDIDECVRIFTGFFPHGGVHRSDENIGHIRNVLRMEGFFFLDREDCPAAMFFEDDLVVSPYYVQALDELLHYAHTAGDVAYVRCIHASRHSLEDQKRNARRTFVMSIGQMWGYGTTREYWRKERSALNLFYEMALCRPYRNLDHNIGQLQWWRLGAPIRFGELDYAKDNAAAYLGYAQIGSYCLAAKYIGEQGVHFSREIYERQGWHQLEMYRDVLGNFEYPSDEEKNSAVAALRQENNAAQRLKLNLGPGVSPMAGWLNLSGQCGFDLQNNKLEEFRANSVEIVYTGHFLQQISPKECVGLLGDIHRVLVPGGVVRISGPSLGMFTERMLQGESRMETFLDSMWPDRDRGDSAMKYYLELCGNPVDLCLSPGKHGQTSLLDADQVIYMLIAAGFLPLNIRKCQYRSSSVEELRGEGFDSRANHSFFVEAEK